MRRWLVSLLAALGVLTAMIPAVAQERAFSYKVVHPIYGVIGTYSKSVALIDGVTRLDSHLRVAVRVLGIVVHREDGDYSETFRGDRLVSLQATTTVNGSRTDVRGEAQGDHFVVTSPAGVADAPGGVAASDPWLLNRLGTGTVVSMKTGHIIPTRITGGEPVTVSVQGVTVPTRHFTAQGETQQETWLNDDDVPIIFRSVESGTPIDFILTSPLRDAAVAEAALVLPTQAPPEGER